VYRGLGVAEPVQQIAIGEYKLCSLSPRCVAKGILWLENADGEGMAFFVEKLEPVLARFFRSNF
jgi:hypothetical protein